MESESSSIALVERGDLEPIPRHPDFRIFAAMNPATDAGACLPTRMLHLKELPTAGARFLCIDNYVPGDAA